jgi:multiple sugar transport system permease protein
MNVSTLPRRDRTPVFATKNAPPGNAAGFKFILPGLTGTCVFILVPFIYIVGMAFSRSKTGRGPGLQNFADVLHNEAFGLAMKNTFAFIGVCIPLLLAFSLLIAVAIHRSAVMGARIKTGFLLTMAIPVSSVVLFWRLLFDTNGFVNGFLHSLGAAPVDWMNTNYAFAILVFSYLWKNLGYNIVLWLAGLSMIPANIYEAAGMDGAGALRRFTRITLPNLMTSVFIITILAVVNSFKVFREAYLVAGEYPHGSIYLIQHLFNNWFRNFEMDKISAAAIINAILLIGMVVALKRCWGRES